MQKRLVLDEPSISLRQAVAPDGYAGIYAFHKYWGKNRTNPLPTP